MRFILKMAALLACSAAVALKVPFHNVNLKPIVNGAISGGSISAGDLLNKPTVVYVVRRPG